MVMNGKGRKKTKLVNKQKAIKFFFVTYPVELRSHRDKDREN